MDSIYFYYNDRYSEDLGVYLVKLDTGMIRDPFLAEQEILMEQVPGNDIPYFYGTRKSPLRVTLTLSCLEGYWTLDKRREVGRWLNCGKFAKFYSTDYPYRWYYLLYEGGIDLYTNGIQQGYLEVSFVNISSFSYSPVYEQVYDFSTITSPTIFEFDNLGDTVLKPELWIYKIEDGDVSIKNLSNGGKEFKFIGLLNQETVYVDNYNRIIETDIPDYYRYDSFNGNYLELLPYSKNRLEISGKCNLKFRFQYQFVG